MYEQSQVVDIIFYREMAYVQGLRCTGDEGVALDEAPDERGLCPNDVTESPWR